MTKCHYTTMKKVLIAGGSGLVGSRLCEILLDSNFEVAILSRSEKSKENIQVIRWDTQSGEIHGDISSYDFIVNLAGSGIADKSWSEKRKKNILESRLNSIDALFKSLKSQNLKPSVIINASAIGYYGDSGDTILTEDTPTQTEEFLSDVCKLWEKSASTLEEVTERLVVLRIGTVLSSKGGALEKIVPPIKLGMANYLGDGSQWVSWIHIDDICRMILHLLENDKAAGIYNGVSPNPMTNKEFTKVIKRVINRFALFMPAPSLAIKTVFGELSRLVLNSNRVSADKIVNSGFTFEYPNLEKAIRQLYRK